MARPEPLLPHPDLDEYCSAWLADQDLDDDFDEDCFFSGDLQEATYQLPHPVIDQQNDLCSQVMQDFQPWKVFEDLFRSNEREVDMTQLKKDGQFDGPDNVTSKRGTFMGDGMSFIHLTLYLSGTVRAVCSLLKVPRPLGQSVGDDIFVMRVKHRLALAFCWQAERTGASFSKLNSISQDSIQFCEQYATCVTDLESLSDLKCMEHSVFGDLLYLDVIKGSILAGKPKVKADGSDPFIGQATMLSKQTKWSPIGFVKERARILVWAANYRSAIGLSGSMASFPRVLGGLDIALGSRQLELRSDQAWFETSYQPWYEGILASNEREFLRCFLLLQGIYKSNPKGFGWSNDADAITKITQHCVIHELKDIQVDFPDFTSTKRTRRTAAERKANMVSFQRLADLLARQESFLRLWNSEIPESRMTLLARNAKHRANKVWAIIKSSIEPLPRPQWRSTNIDALAQMFDARTWGKFISRDDPAVSRLFDGMPSLEIEFV